LQEAIDYAAWDTPERISHFARLVEASSQIEAFGVRDLRIGSAIVAWSDVLEWWMAPDTADRSPTPASVSRWYNFASKHFIYGLNWAIGAIIGSILERDGGDGQFFERWLECELPWSVLWYKDMVSWGTLDPVASYVLTEKEAYTRPIAAQISVEYWEEVDEINDAVLEPTRVAEWMSRWQGGRATIEEEQLLPGREIPVELREDFSRYTGTQLHVLPAIAENQIYWYDPAGYLLAQSNVPENWHNLNTYEVDFMLDPSATIVTWQYYL